MCTNKSYKHILNSKFYYGYQPVIVAFYVKDVMLVFNAINAVESLFYVGKARLCSSTSLAEPIFQCFL